MWGHHYRFTLFLSQLFLQERGRRRADQTLSKMQSLHREGRGLRTDDVQELQARVLLVLLGVPGCELDAGSAPNVHRELNFSCET